MMLARLVFGLLLGTSCALRTEISEQMVSRIAKEAKQTPEDVLEPEEVMEHGRSRKESLVRYINRTHDYLVTLYKSPEFQDQKERYLKLVVTFTKTVAKYIQDAPGADWLSEKVWPLMKPALLSVKELALFVKRITEFLAQDPYVAKMSKKVRDMAKKLYNIATKIISELTKLIADPSYRNQVSTMSRSEIREAIKNLFVGNGDQGLSSESSALQTEGNAAVAEPLPEDVIQQMRD